MPSSLLLEVLFIFLFSGVPLSHALQEVHVSRETIGKISAASKMMQCSAAVDLLFLIDGSHSVGKGSFERSKHFAITVCDALDINPERVRVGAMQFSSAPRLEFPLDALSSQQEVKAKIKRMVFKGGRTETGLALKYLLRQGFPGGRNASVPQILVVVTDGRSQGHVALPAKQLKERRITIFAVGVRFPRWEELHTLASEPRERHVLTAEQVEDATNGLLSALSASALCTAASPDCEVQPHPCEHKTLETVRELVGSARCWRGSRGSKAVLAAVCPFSSWKRVYRSHHSTCYRTTCPGACDSQPCQNGGTCLPEGLDKYHCLCPPAFRGEANCAPKLSLECRIDILFLLASSAGTTPEGFLRAKAFVKRFVQVSLSEDSRTRVGVAWYSGELAVAVPVGEYRDVPALLESLDSLPFRGGATLTGSALRQAAEQGFGSAARTGQDRPRRVLVLLTESPSQDEVASPARHARARELLLLGVGTEAVRAELEEITGSPKHVLVYTGPRDLFHRIPELQGKLCGQPRPGCQARSLDLLFLLDASISVGPENFAQMQSFVRSLTLQFDVNPDVTQVGLVVYGGRVRTAFGLDTHLTRAAVLRAMSQAPYLGGVGSAGTALLHVYDKVMTVQRGARPGVPKAVVLLTGGMGAEDAAVPVQKLRNNGVSVLVVGVGPVLREALRRLAGPRDSLIHVASYADLRYHQDELLAWICAEARQPVSLCKPSPCLHEGTCILRNGSYRCECRDGWQGPHCGNRSLRGDAPKARGSHPEPAEGQQPYPSQQPPRRPGRPGH
ncbi:von Willebrand factor A domain-containing protein 2 isoform X1 [Mustela erminea]|uniref:von Willebrand factor A domain-containing protein 2 isoform X1 n=1 Tax=Mustela erminea TaxID=36723 RepID=UPI00138704BD|nr:von Willebrand factor A domain-containing protein 2 isoform X1 [Mustela erminea]XP_032168225.1 von Willebrand factor A domain-containing protein 2 isoform X1 [Mustela erminea]XP_032168226.1 von Willebrand factor A domain-containing protein 2 isoform X1 [Mustela erminea]XP_032168227.1 von Willebrand factor A domain-containing protein 2 isoform X1 [Mustela erminea]XP_032168228.1 von Willebrand factor A domain-containing protein 2 isoform X1 [Mustela erminea]